MPTQEVQQVALLVAGWLFGVLLIAGTTSSGSTFLRGLCSKIWLLNAKSATDSPEG